VAAAELGKREFIFDVQGPTSVNPVGAWLGAPRRRAPKPLSGMPKAG